jgi:diguanylate cyclase (GGDEF)-like protein
MLHDSRLGDEPARIAALERYQVLDTAPESAFDDIVALVRASLSVPIAVVSLVDHERQWFKAQSGLAVCETARSISFCTHTILTRAPMIIGDARADERFRNNPLVTGDPFIAAYAGVPLASPDGYNIGSLCAIDTVPRKFTLVQIDILRGLAKLVMTELGLRQQTQHDALTGLLTRGAIVALARLELARRDRHDRPAVLLMFDVDHFRDINERFGHPGGDRILRSVATCAAAALRTGDQIARVGGDEFMILLPETSVDEAEFVAERVRRSVAALVQPDQPGGAVTISIGIAPLASHIDNFDAWAVAVDQLLYCAKQSGRNCARRAGARVAVDA